MATQLQLRRGTTSENGSFTGALGEVTVDTDKDTLVVHDGATAGGHEMAKADGTNIEKLTKSGATKIATTSSGVDVTGNVTASGTVNALNVTAATNGSVYAQYFGNSSDTNTLIQFAGSDDIRMRTGGVEGMRINSSQDVSIPNGNLSVTGKTVVNSSNITNPQEGVVQMATVTSDSGDLWTGINTGGHAYSSMPSELSIMNTADNTTNSFSGVFFQAGENSAGAGINAARIGAIRTGSINTDLAFANRGPNGMLEGLRIDSSQNVSIPNGNLGVGGTPVFSTAEIFGDKTISNNLQLTLKGASNTNKQLIMGFDTTANKSYLISQEAGQSFKPLEIKSSNVSIPNGNLLVGTTDVTPGQNDTNVGTSISNVGRLIINNAGSDNIMGRNTDGVLLSIRKAGEEKGSIAVNSSSTSYNTSSDYRLKEDVQAMSGATDRLKELKPVNFAWKVDGSRVDGFLAHEAQEVVPESVSGSKDGMKTEKYEVSAATGDIYTPAVEAVEGVEAVEYVAPVEAQEAVMGERQKMETVEKGTYVNLAGETITETEEVGVTEEQVQTVVERQDIDGVMTEVEVEKTVSVPVMESYEISPAVEAVAEVMAVEAVEAVEAIAEVIVSSNVERPETLEDGQLWRETTAQVMGEREVPDYQGIDQAKLVPLLVATIQELEARITALEA